MSLYKYNFRKNKLFNSALLSIIFLAVSGCNLTKKNSGPNPFSSINNQLVITNEIKSEERYACISKSSAKKTYVTVESTNFHDSCDGIKATFVKVFDKDDYSSTDMSKDIIINGYQRNAWSKYKFRIALLDRVRLDIEHQKKTLKSNPIFKLYTTNALNILSSKYDSLKTNNGHYYTPVLDVDEIWKSISYDAKTARILSNLNNTNKSNETYDICSNLSYPGHNYEKRFKHLCSNKNINSTSFTSGTDTAFLDTINNGYEKLKECKKNNTKFNQFVNNRVSINPEIIDLTGFYKGKEKPINEIKINKNFDNQCNLSTSTISATSNTTIEGYQVEKDLASIQAHYSERNIELKPKINIIRKNSSMIKPNKKYQDNNISISLNTIDDQGTTSFIISNNTNKYLKINATSLYIGNKVLTHNKVISMPPMSEESTYQTFDLPYKVKNNFFPRAGFNNEMASKKNNIGMSVLYSIGGVEYTLHSIDTMSFYELM